MVLPATWEAVWYPHAGSFAVREPMQPNPIDQFLAFGRRGRLALAAVCPEAMGLVYLLQTASAAEHDRDHWVKFRAGSQPLQHLPAGYPGHIGIEQNQVRQGILPSIGVLPIPSQILQCLLPAVHRLERILIAHFPQRASKYVHVLAAIVHQQNRSDLAPLSPAKCSHFKSRLQVITEGRPPAPCEFSWLWDQAGSPWRRGKPSRPGACV